MRYFVMGTLLSTVVLTVGAMAADQEVDRSTPVVGVLACDEFYYPNGNFAFTWQNTVALLEDCGIPCLALTPELLMDETVFNPRRVPVLVNIYGDAFPAAALPALERYHRAGGCLVSNGVPFGFLCRRDGKGWTGVYPEESQSPRRHESIGTGLWKRLPAFGSVQYHADSDPLDLGDLPLSAARVDVFFGLDAASLPEGDRLTPIVTVRGRGDGDGEAVAVGVIEHGCGIFDGAIDIWAGSHLYSEPLPVKIAIQQQLFIRSCAWLLERRGVIDAGARAGILDRARVRYSSIPLHAGDWPTPPTEVDPSAAIPRSATPADAWVVVDLRGTDPAARRAAISLQGLLNRDRPFCYVLATPEDEGWLHWLHAAYAPNAAIRQIEVEAFFQEFAAGRFPAVIYDPDALHAAANVATAWAAAHNAIVATEDVAARYGLEVAEDLRKRTFAASHEAFDWALRSWAPGTPRRTASIAPSRDLISDYLIAHRIFPFWVSGPRDAVEPGGDVLGEIRFAQRLLSATPLNTPVFGFGHFALYRGIGEAEMVEMVSRFGKYQVVTGQTPNLSFFSGFRVESLKQKRRTPPQLDPSRVYVALIVSDGDNVNYWHARFPKLWQDPGRGTFPINWSIGPAAMDLEGPMVARAYADATENDHFVAAVSGAGYIYPEIYGTAFAEPAPIFQGFLEQTRALMTRMDIATLHIHHHGPYGETSPATLARYAEFLPALPGDPATALFVGYSRRDYASTYDQSHFEVGGGVPVFYSLSQGNVATVVADIGAAPGETRPAFVYAITHPWRLKPAEFKREFDALGPDFELVTAEELAALYRQHHGSPADAAAD